MAVGWVVYMMEKPFKGVGAEIVPSLLCFNSGDSMKKKIDKKLGQVNRFWGNCLK